MKQGIYQWKNQLNQTTLSGPKLNWRLWKDRLCRHSPLQQSEVWSPSSDMESGWACFVLLKGRLSVLGKAAHSPCWSLTFTPHFAELQSGLPYVGHSFPWPNNQAEQSEVQWRTQPRPWPLNCLIHLLWLQCHGQGRALKMKYSPTGSQIWPFNVYPVRFQLQGVRRKSGNILTSFNDVRRLPDLLRRPCNEQPPC